MMLIVIATSELSKSNGEIINRLGLFQFLKKVLIKTVQNFYFQD